MNLRSSFVILQVWFSYLSTVSFSLILRHNKPVMLNLGGASQFTFPYCFSIYIHTDLIRIIQIIICFWYSSHSDMCENSMITKFYSNNIYFFFSQFIPVNLTFHLRLKTIAKPQYTAVPKWKKMALAGPLYFIIWNHRPSEQKRVMQDNWICVASAIQPTSFHIFKQLHISSTNPFL